MLSRIYNLSARGMRPLIDVWGRQFQLAAIAACCVVAPLANAQDIGKLYAARPPEGYAFVRVAVANISEGAVDVQIALAAAHIDQTAVASRYRAVKAGRPVHVSIAGSVVDDRIIPLADQFSTVVLERQATGWRSYVIEEGHSNLNDLKAQLRFFNLATECQASLRIANGPVIFDAIASRNVRSRAINPVQAQLEALCDGQSVSLALPQLRAGDHFSIFLRGRAGQLNLSGQHDETEPFKDR
ncbi:MAG: cell division protein FtsQ [Pseudomonadota bacterium]